MKYRCRVHARPISRTAAARLEASFPLTFIVIVMVGLMSNARRKEAFIWRAQSGALRVAAPACRHRGALEVAACNVGMIVAKCNRRYKAIS